jgi:hypothetical protein
MKYDIVWDGSHRGVNADLLCVGAADIRDMSHIQPARWRVGPKRDYQRHDRLRAHVLVLLEQRDRWRIADLRAALGCDAPLINGIVQRLRRNRVVRTVDYGTITLVRRQTGAAA